MSDNKRLVMVGCGKMGGALLRGWQGRKLYKILTVIDPVRPAHLPKDAHYTASLDDGHLEKAEIVLLAVKPAMLPELCPKIASKISPATLVVSVAAGWMISDYAPYFAPEQPIIRTIPNTPAAIGKGVTALVGNAQANRAHMQWAEQAFQAVGKTVLLQDERLMDVVTALASSGPAYVFYLTEVLSDLGTKLGLDAPLSATLARQMVVGSSALLESFEATSPADLRAQVTSPNGTTHAAITALQRDDRFTALFEEALKAAIARAEAMRTEK